MSIETKQKVKKCWKVTKEVLIVLWYIFYILFFFVLGIALILIGFFVLLYVAFSYLADKSDKYLYHK